MLLLVQLPHELQQLLLRVQTSCSRTISSKLKVRLSCLRKQRKLGVTCWRRNSDRARTPKMLTMRSSRLVTFPCARIRPLASRWTSCCTLRTEMWQLRWTGHRISIGRRLARMGERASSSACCARWDTNSSAALRALPPLGFASEPAGADGIPR